MGPNELRSDLLDRIRQLTDPAILQQVKALLDMHAGGRWEGLPEAVRAGILEGFEQSERGEGTPHAAVMEKARAWRGK
ncbi:MAG: hypothetical protein U0U25_08810 [Flavobacteriales bacterium]